MAIPRLSKRQETAQRLTRELQAFGATVTNVLPLAEGQHLRFSVNDYRKNEVLQQLADAGYEPNFLKMEMQPDIHSYSMGLVNVFELPIAADREPIPDDRHSGEIVGKTKRSHEVEEMLKYVYGKQKQ